jgi:regulator of cell morphogenesis and NO signaling
MLSPDQSVASVVLDHSECAEVFKRHRIDFCCRGDASLQAAATERGVKVDALIDELLLAVTQRNGARVTDPRELTTPDLIALIVSRHHDYLRRALPFVRGLAAKVSRVHADHNPKLRDLDAAVAELSDVLLPHIDDEEETLFPRLTEMEVAPAATSKLVDEMVAEHLDVSRLLERARAAAEDFTVPDWACTSYRTLFSELRNMEADIFTHVHLENHVLRPRFAASPPEAPQAMASGSPS